MNKNSNSVCKVVSKYFVKEAAMDDSFADFQESKRIKLGPVTIPKHKKTSQKKSLKRSKGQKDIRSLIKNELVSYSQDFDQVCKQSGVDVDAEQLQLAIALSKSLNEFQSSSKDVENENRQLSSQERSAKIRTTLQEYGFKVNNTKILLSLLTNKRKKYKKHSKLLQISNEERQQKIDKRYSEVLANNICKSDGDIKCIYLKHAIFYKATNIPYHHIKNNEIFYVSNLVDKPTHKTCLLRDWSEIPGRPVSPKLKNNDINFDNIQCSQDDLDNILSGSLDIAQKIINSKQFVEEKQTITDPSKDYICNEYSDTTDIIEPIPSLEHSNDSQTNKSNIPKMSDHNIVTEVQINYVHDREKEKSMKHSIQLNIECLDLLKDTNPDANCSPKTLRLIDSQKVNSKQIRSASPDLFDEEVSSIIDDKNDCSTIETDEVHSTIENKKHNGSRDSITKYDNCGTIFMDLTECANFYSNLNIPNTDITKRKSNDNMDITECVDVKSNNNSNVDILRSGEAKDVELIDLTQVSNLLHNCAEIEKKGTKKDISLEVDDTIIYDNIVFTKAVNESINLQEPIVLWDESISKDAVNDKKLSEYDNAVNNSNHCMPDEGNERNSQNIIENLSLNFEFEDKNNDDINIDLTQVSERSENYSLNYPEFINDDCGSETISHNSHTLNKDKDSDLISLKSVTSDNDIENQDEDIDLTQDSEKSFEVTEENYTLYCANNDNRRFENFDSNVVALKNKTSSILSLENMAINIQPFEENNEDDKIDLTQTTAEIEERNTATSHLGNKNISKLGKYYKNKSVLGFENIEDISENVEENHEDDKIDLTQATEEIEVNTAPSYSYLGHKNNSKLGKIDNISIDYDEMFDEITSENRNKFKHTLKSNSSGKDDNSEVFEISDKELNYSIHHSLHENFDIHFENTRRVSLNRSLSEGCLPTVSLVQTLSPIKEKNKSQSNTPIKINTDIEDAIVQTPKNNEYIIKTRDVTPMADYEAMTSPERDKELEKYGLKPFKRKRAIQLLTYVYNQTHPVIESCSPEEGPSKRFKLNSKYPSPKKNSKSPKKCLNFGSDVNKENDIFVVTKETPDIKNIECDPKEWVFQNREKAKVHSCRVPLHIAFHNYVSCRRLLKEAILRYEPVNIDVIHKDLVSYGHKYNPKDLLKFMDRRCITVKTVENNLKNKK